MQLVKGVPSACDTYPIILGVLNIKYPCNAAWSDVEGTAGYTPNTDHKTISRSLSMCRLLRVE
jgi:hypothetical protein